MSQKQSSPLLRLLAGFVVLLVFGLLCFWIFRGASACCADEWREAIRLLFIGRIPILVLVIGLLFPLASKLAAKNMLGNLFDLRDGQRFWHWFVIGLTLWTLVAAQFYQLEVIWRSSVERMGLAAAIDWADFHEYNEVFLQWIPFSILLLLLIILDGDSIRLSLDRMVFSLARVGGWKIGPVLERSIGRRLEASRPRGRDLAVNVLSYLIGAFTAAFLLWLLVRVRRYFIADIRGIGEAIWAYIADYLPESTLESIAAMFCGYNDEHFWLFLSALIYVFLFATAFLSNGVEGRGRYVRFRPGVVMMVGVFFSLMLVGAVVAAWCFFFDAWGVPSVLLLGLLLLALHGAFGTNAFYYVWQRTPQDGSGGGGGDGAPPPPAPNDPTQPGSLKPFAESAEDAAKRWIENWQGRKERPMTAFCCHGGGIQAAVWTAESIARTMAYSSRKAFNDSVVMLSGVSGGAVGMLYLLDQMRSISDKPTNSIRTNSELREALERQMDRVADHSLGAVGAGLAYSDTPSFFKLPHVCAVLPPLRRRGWGSWNRGTWLENSLIGALSNGAEAGADGYGPPFALSEAVEQVRKRVLPHISMNATDATTGSPFTFSTALLGPRGAAMGVSEFGVLRSDFDIELATAARMSSTFPYVTNMCRPYDWDSQTPLAEGALLCDGGYYDNSGLDVALTWILAILDELVESGKKDVLPTKILINHLYGFVVETPTERVASAASDGKRASQKRPPVSWPDRIKSVFVSGMNFLLGPLTTLLALWRRSQHGRRSIIEQLLYLEPTSTEGEMPKAVGKLVIRGTEIEVCVRDIRPLEGAPSVLSWFMNARERAQLRGRLDAIGQELKELALDFDPEAAEREMQKATPALKARAKGKKRGR